MRDRPLDEDLVDIACQLRGEIDLQQSALQGDQERDSNIYLLSGSGGFRYDVLFAPFVAYCLPAGLYPCRGFDVAHSVTCMDALSVGWREREVEETNQAA